MAPAATQRRGTVSFPGHLYGIYCGRFNTGKVPPPSKKFGFPLSLLFRQCYILIFLSYTANTATLMNEVKK
jgi:hypothetical protein